MPSQRGEVVAAARDRQALASRESGGAQDPSQRAQVVRALQTEKEIRNADESGATRRYSVPSRGAQTALGEVIFLFKYNHHI